MNQGIGVSSRACDTPHPTENQCPGRWPLARRPGHTHVRHHPPNTGHVRGRSHRLSSLPGDSVSRVRGRCQSPVPGSENGAAMTAGRQGRTWRTLAARMRVELPPVCWICGQGIDLSLDGQRDPMAWTLDHVLPVATHPHLAEEPSNLRAAHRRCNSSKGTGDKGPKPKSSRRWN